MTHDAHHPKKAFGLIRDHGRNVQILIAEIFIYGVRVIPGMLRPDKISVKCGFLSELMAVSERFSTFFAESQP
ncbi:MAG: hypothetical protein H7833_00875 [Magnetococcus sp. DMHC-1]|nr:hypothetical protein [Magnetococcales bacterium]